ncbi:GC [Mytilus edulis]|uniref:SLC25A18_22 n=1 Tax=Mytilus edulis TaxID=6550 RepID=A0A8S3QK93_MYTED|nr:GC [Mytilus edulis]
MQGYMININTCPKVILTCIPGIGEAIAGRIMDIRAKGIHIDRDVLFQIPHLRVTEGILGIIDFSRRPRAELREAVRDRACSVSMLPPKPDHVIVDMEPEEYPCSSFKDTGTQDEVESSCSEDGACSSLEWDKHRLEQIQSRSEHLTMLEQLHCKPSQESLSSESLNSDLSVCSNEYHTQPPRINMVAHPQPDSQQDGDVPYDRMFIPLSQNWHIQNPVVDQQEDCNHQQEVQQTPPRYKSPDYDQQPRFLHTPTPDHVHFSPSVQHEHHYVDQYQHGFNSLHRLEVNKSQQSANATESTMPTTTARPASTRAPVSIPQQRLQQQVSEVVHQQPNYPEPRFQPPSSVPEVQQHKMIGHPTSMYQPPRGEPPPQAPTNVTPYNQQYIPGLTYPSLGQPQPLHVPQLPIPGTQQQPPPSGAPQLHYNQPSARQKEYNSDYYGRQERSDPRHKYTGDSDTSNVSAYRQTRTKRRSEPEYNRPRENQQHDFSPLRSVRSFPLHRSRSSPRRSRGSSDSQSESDTDGQSSESSQESRKKEKMEKRQFLYLLNISTVVKNKFLSGNGSRNNGHKENEKKIYVSFSSAFISGAVASLSVNPFDVVKTRLQTLTKGKNEKTYAGITDCFRKIYKTEGWTAFYKGGTSRIIAIAILFGVAQTVYWLEPVEHTIKLYTKYRS